MSELRNWGSALLVLLLALVARGEQPNVILLITDDMNLKMVGAYSGQVETPNLDRLVREGSSFMNAYNMGAWGPAVCIPSRTMLNTGKSLWRAKEAAEGEWKGRLWSELMREGGYATYFTGKWHCEAGPRLEALFDEVGLKTPGQLSWRKEGRMVPWDRELGGFWTEEGHMTDRTAADVIRFVEEAAGGEKPFFIYAGFNLPHVPRQAEKRYFELYPKSEIELPLNMKERSEDVEMKWAKKVTPDLVRSRYQENFAMVAHFDESVGRILESVEKSDAAKDTVVIFMSDHGINLGENGVVGKECLYDLSMQAPLVFWGAGIESGKRFEAGVYLQSVMPTVLEMGEVVVPGEVEFPSLGPVLRGDREVVQEVVYGAFEERMRCLVDGNWKLIRYFKPEGVVDRLFDLGNDPLEAEDLAGREETGPVVERLRKRLSEEARMRGDPMAEQLGSGGAR
ncbi:MAG: sulfatase-like hydrolase/transferase [Verrucomicrobiota bacterium]